MLASFHRLACPVAGAIAITTIIIFLLSTIASELSGNSELIKTVKSAIPYGLFVLIPSIAITGATGFKNAAGRSRQSFVSRKIRRMPFIVANGVLALVPAALFLSVKAQAGDSDGSFYLIQGIELFVGTLNLLLLALCLRDGLSMTQRQRNSRLRNKANNQYPNPVDT